MPALRGMVQLKAPERVKAHPHEQPYGGPKPYQPEASAKPRPIQDKRSVSEGRANAALTHGDPR